MTKRQMLMNETKWKCECQIKRETNTNALQCKHERILIIRIERDGAGKQKRKFLLGATARGGGATLTLKIYNVTIAG